VPIRNHVVANSPTCERSATTNTLIGNESTERLSSNAKRSRHSADFESSS
jgi:hypothetical protein